ncbi:MAG: hypothetical protein ACK5IN_02775 [Microbacterium sp.]|uniref:hypothetical protein n=1 Tax=Microbacterium sp. TaxID=51671 RepID=UPI003A844C90
MDVFWIVLGLLVLIITILDCLRTVLNYDQPGIFMLQLQRMQWAVLRFFTRRAHGRLRHNMLRQATGIMLITSVLWWLLGILLGFAFIYLGAAGFGAIVRDKGAPVDFWTALYLSIGQFSTVGSDAVTVQNPWIDYATVLQSLTSVLLMSLIITFLLNVFGAIRSLSDLCGNFTRPGAVTEHPIDALAPYFPRGRARDVDTLVSSVSEDFTSYTDDLRQNRVAYYFQSGRNQFSLPFALRMAAGLASALRWGLPTGSEISELPELDRLLNTVVSFGEWFNKTRSRVPAPTAEPVTKERFAAQVNGDGDDRWVADFLAMTDQMSQLTGASGPTDVDDAYARYTQWLPFQARMKELFDWISRSLDYRPEERAEARYVE